jgi:hypothetical protein
MRTAILCIGYFSSDIHDLSEDGGLRLLDINHNFGLVPPTGVNLQTTDLAPGAITPMVRTHILSVGQAAPNC